MLLTPMDSCSFIRRQPSSPRTVCNISCCCWPQTGQQRPQQRMQPHQGPAKFLWGGNHWYSLRNTRKAVGLAGEARNALISTSFPRASFQRKSLIVIKGSSSLLVDVFLGQKEKNYKTVLSSCLEGWQKWSSLSCGRRLSSLKSDLFFLRHQKETMQDITLPAIDWGFAPSIRV